MIEDDKKKRRVSYVYSLLMITSGWYLNMYVCRMSEGKEDLVDEVQNVE